jgi:hypothetical protein
MALVCYLWYDFSTLNKQKQNNMKKLVLTLGLVAGLTALTNAQEVTHAPGDGHNHDAAATPTTAPASLADIKLDKMVHDYGNIKQGDNGECEFKFINNGKEPLVISNCQGSCGCTVPQCPK